MSPEDKITLLHIAYACRAIIENAPPDMEDYYATHSFQLSAIIRHIELIGEEAKSLSEDIRQELSDLPWRKFIRTRDKFSHGYFLFDFEIIWKIATRDVPSLLEELTSRYPEL
jgi:uncharacterized protein with HEPN domain